MSEELNKTDTQYGPLTEMPEYTSHQEIWALKIKDIVFDKDAAEVEGRESTGEAMIFPEDENYKPFMVSAEYVQMFSPVVGGYYTQYKNGWAAFHVAEPFEAGYKKVNP